MKIHHYYFKKKKKNYPTRTFLPSISTAMKALKDNWYSLENSWLSSAVSSTNESSFFWCSVCWGCSCFSTWLFHSYSLFLGSLFRLFHFSLVVEVVFVAVFQQCFHSFPLVAFEAGFLDCRRTIKKRERMCLWFEYSIIN